MAKKKLPKFEFDESVFVAWANTHAKQIAQAHNTFYIQYGKALDGWSILENFLSRFFAKLTGMKPTKARRVFYSARSFNGRADMFEAALSATRLPKELHAFLKTVIKTCRSYSNFRNIIAHGEMNLHILEIDDEGQPKLEMLLTEPKYVERMQIGFGISAKDLSDADDAFRVLAGDLQMALTGELFGPSLETRRERILQRPKLGHSKAIGPTPAPRKRRPRSSRA